MSGVLLATLLLAATHNHSLEPAVTVSFDFTQAEHTIRFLRTGSGDLAELTALPSTAGVLKKALSGDKSLTLSNLTESLKKARAGDKSGADPFQWRTVVRNLDQIDGLVTQIRKSEAELGESLGKKLTSVAPAGTSLAVTVRFIVGTASAGWAPDRKTLYIGLHHYAGDYQGVRMTLQHELFHNVQFAAYKTEELDTKRLSKRQGELFELCRYIFLEGTASYFADPEAFTPAGGFLKEVLEPQRENLDRISENFLLLDLFLFRLSRDPDARFEDLYPIGFDWSWKNPFYFVGLEMTKHLVRAHGDDYLRRSLGQNPVQFVSDYVDLCHAKDASDALPRLSKDSEKVLRRLKSSLPKSRKAP